MEKGKKQQRVIFTKKPVVVLKGGKVVEHYASLTKFWEQYPNCNIATTSKRIRACLDGWMPDGKKARFVGEEKKRGRKIDICKVREQEGGSEEKTIASEIERSRKAIEELYARYDAGEIGIEERQREIGWYQNHILVMQSRLNYKRKKSRGEI